MRLKRLILLASAGVSSGQTLAEVLTAQSATLSMLNSWLSSQELIFTILSGAQGVTLLAPSNDALTELYNSPLANQLAQDPNLLTAFLAYHVLDGIFFNSHFVNTQPHLSLPTLLDIDTFSNVSGGQRIISTSQNGAVTFFSGHGAQAAVQGADYNYAGGTLHIIESCLTIPGSVTNTLIAAGLTAALGALRRCKMEDRLNTDTDVTIFVPNNDAFKAIGSLVDGMTLEQLTTVLNYHVVPGKVLYSQQISGGGQALTAEGAMLNFRTLDGELFVNSARIVQPNLLIANGVVHVCDGVLNPANATAAPNPSASTQEPAFAGASSTDGEVPFTSAIPTVTSPATSTVSGGSAGGNNNGGSGSSGNSDGGGGNNGGGGSGGSSGARGPPVAAAPRTSPLEVAALLGGAVVMAFL